MKKIILFLAVAIGTSTSFASSDGTCKSTAEKAAVLLATIDPFGTDLLSAKSSVKLYDVNGEVSDWQVIFSWKEDGLESALIYDVTTSGVSCAVTKVQVTQAG